MPDLTTQLGDELVFIMGVESLGVADRLSIDIIVRTAQRLEEIEAALAEDSVVVRGSKRQPRAHPLLGIERQLRSDVSRELERLGLTPEARRRALWREKSGTAMDGALDDLLASIRRPSST
ncbi:MAG: P27 family phage terminase small subunit [Gaiella sp.]